MEKWIYNKNPFRDDLSYILIVVMISQVLKTVGMPWSWISTTSLTEILPSETRKTRDGAAILSRHTTLEVSLSC